MEQNKSCFHNKNAGSSLILVILCMSIVGILGAMMLSTTMLNRQMKVVDAKSKDNFYSVERAMDEIVAGFEELADKALRESYRILLVNYTLPIDSSVRKLMFKHSFSETLTTSLKEFIKNPDNLTKLLSRGDLTNWTGGEVKILNAGEPKEVTLPSGDPGVALEAFSISYTDSEAYETTLTTDLVFEVKYPEVNVTNSASKNVGFQDYVIIADKTIKNNAVNHVNPDAVIEGNIYAGGYQDAIKGYAADGILVSGNIQLTDGREETKGSLTIKGNIVTRTSIRSISGGRITIEAPGPVSGGEEVLPKVWARNIILDGTGGEIDINAAANIADDLTLNANGGKVNLKGAYYGYNSLNATSGNSHGTAEGSSAIVINGKNSILDMSSLDTLWVAGKAYVKVPSTYGSVTGYEGKNAAILQGEALAYKGNQAAYMLPGECIIGIGHNPVTEAEYKRLTTPPAEGESPEYYIDLSKGKLNDTFLGEYVQTGNTVDHNQILSNSYKIATVRYAPPGDGSSGSNMVYLYLNFQSPNSASDYFKKYNDVNSDLVKNRVKNIGSGRILLNESFFEQNAAGDFITSEEKKQSGNLVLAGNITGYFDPDQNINGTEAPKVVLLPRNASYYDAEVQNMLLQKANQYNGMCDALTEDFPVTTMSEFLTNRFVDWARLTQDITWQFLTLKPSEETYSLEPYQFCASKGNVPIDHDMKAIVLAEGDVTIGSGVKFEGLIIAKGSVNLQGSAFVTANYDEVSEFIKNGVYMDDGEEKSIIPFFKSFYTEESGGSSGSIENANNAVLIRYENWRKN